MLALLEIIALIFFDVITLNCFGAGPQEYERPSGVPEDRALGLTSPIGPCGKVPNSRVFVQKCR